MTSKTPKPYKEKRPWGDFVEFTRDEVSTVKIITVRANEALSLQSHSSRDEFWRVIGGEGEIQIGEKIKRGSPGEEFFIPKGTKHRITAGDQDFSILEISFGKFDENDITRYEDRYGRVEKNINK